MKKEIVEFLKPDKRRVLLSLTIPYIWSGSLLFLSLINRVYLQYMQTNVATIYTLPATSIPPIILLIFNNLVLSVLIYPFACSIAVLYKYHKTGRTLEMRRNKSLVFLIFIGLLVFNPASLKIIEGVAFLFLSLVFSTPYQGGVEILEVTPNAPGEAIGFKPRDIVIEMKIIRDNKVIEDKKINNSNDFFEILNKTKSGDYLSFRKLGGDVRGHRIQETGIKNKEWGIKVRELPRGHNAS